MEANTAFRLELGLDELLDDVEDHLELSVVLSLQNGQLSGELFVGGQEQSKANEDSHDFDIDEDG